MILKMQENPAWTVFISIVATVIFVLDIMSPLGLASWLGYIICLLISYHRLSTKTIILLTSGSSLLIILGGVLSPPGMIRPDIAFANRCGAIVVVTIMSFMLIKQKRAEAELQSKLRELEEALESVKLLSGLLPICAWCKKIRNDSGYWEQIDAYITEHSNALFSHGICPECAEKVSKELGLRPPHKTQN
ncbi:MAG: hypothetical protein M0024_14855 [Nitrospiraceae bacterium]|nr:hypothetical protein [Nitrospiraceae bacterium]